MIEKEVVVNGEYELSATLTIPETDEERFPAIVIVPGTGGADRDGNMKNFEMNIYKQLADFLPSLGFITIRYDKRGIGKSKGVPYETGMHDLMDDIIHNIKYLESVPNVDPKRIILLGHSEGCILNTIVHQKNPVAGLILIAGAGTGLKTAMQSQNLMIVKEVQAMKGLKGIMLRRLVSEKGVIDKQNKLFNKVLESNDDVMKIQFQKFPAKWMREHLHYTDEQILAMLKETQCPVLAIAGDKDVQADSEALKDIEALEKANITCLTIPNMDHVLREYTGETSVLNVKKQYKEQIIKPLHPVLESEIKLWLLQHFGEEPTTSE